MNPIPTTGQLRHQATREEVLVHDWRVEQLRRQGLSRELAEIFAGHVDWHVLADLVQRGCPPHMALIIVS